MILHSAAHHDHCERCRIRTQDLCPRSLVRFQGAATSPTVKLVIICPETRSFRRNFQVCVTFWCQGFSRSGRKVFFLLNWWFNKPPQLVQGSYPCSWYRGHTQARTSAPRAPPKKFVNNVYKNGSSSISSCYFLARLFLL